jgi:hypothetical protein
MLPGAPSRASSFLVFLPSSSPGHPTPGSRSQTRPTPRPEARPAETKLNAEGLYATAASPSTRAVRSFLQSTTDQKTWVNAPVTLEAKTDITGLTPNTTYYFRFRGVTRAGEGDYSQVVSLVVL